MRFITTFQAYDFLDTLVSLSAAFVLGTLIGAERQYRLRTAGLRTNVLVAVGAAAFVDPFTGSGMLMALESGELAAHSIVRHRNKLLEEYGSRNLCDDYAREYGQKFDSRLRVCDLLRRVAFKPRLAQLAITLCGASDRFRHRLARATRSSATSPRTI